MNRTSPSARSWSKAKRNSSTTSASTTCGATATAGSPAVTCRRTPPRTTSGHNRSAPGALPVSSVPGRRPHLRDAGRRRGPRPASGTSATTGRAAGSAAEWNAERNSAAPRHSRPACSHWRQATGQPAPEPGDDEGAAQRGERSELEPSRPRRLGPQPRAHPAPGDSDALNHQGNSQRVIPPGRGEIAHRQRQDGPAKPTSWTGKTRDGSKEAKTEARPRNSGPDIHSGLHLRLTASGSSAVHLYPVLSCKLPERQDTPTEPQAQHHTGRCRSGSHADSARHPQGST